MKKVHLFILFTFAFSAMTQAQISSDLLKKANAGDAAAMNLVGKAYMYGNGVKQSYEEAIQWFTKAANKGYAISMTSIGNIYYRTSDYSKAKEWYEKAVKAGDEDAKCWLGYLYEYGYEECYLCNIIKVVLYLMFYLYLCKHNYFYY